MSKYSKAAEEAISEKMEKMKDEDKPQKQKVAIAISVVRGHGFKVPDALVKREKKEKRRKEK